MKKRGLSLQERRKGRRRAEVGLKLHLGRVLPGTEWILGVQWPWVRNTREGEPGEQRT